MERGHLTLPWPEGFMSIHDAARASLPDSKLCGQSPWLHKY